MVRVSRWVVVVAAVAACAKQSSNERAPAATGGANQSVDQPVSAQPQPPPPDPDPERARNEAMDKARNEAILGPAGHTDAFEPLEKNEKNEKGGDGKRDPKTDKKLKGKTGGGSKTSTSDGSPLGGFDGVDSAKPATPYRANIGAVRAADGGVLSPQLVRAIRARGMEVQRCYDKQRAKTPTLVGTIVLTFTVLPSGAVTSAAVESTSVKHVELEACVVQAFAASKISSAPDAETKVKLTIDLSTL